MEKLRGIGNVFLRKTSIISNFSSALNPRKKGRANKMPKQQFYRACNVSTDLDVTPFV